MTVGRVQRQSGRDYHTLGNPYTVTVKCLWPIKYCGYHSNHTHGVSYFLKIMSTGQTELGNGGAGGLAGGGACRGSKSAPVSVCAITFFDFDPIPHSLTSALGCSLSRPTCQRKMVKTDVLGCVCRSGSESGCESRSTGRALINFLIPEACMDTLMQAYLVCTRLSMAIHLYPLPVCTCNAYVKPMNSIDEFNR